MIVWEQSDEGNPVEGNSNSCSPAELLQDFGAIWSVLENRIPQHPTWDWDTILCTWQPWFGTFWVCLSSGVDLLSQWTSSNTYFEALHNRFELADDPEAAGSEITKMVLKAVSESLNNALTSTNGLRAVLQYDVQFVVLMEPDEPPVFQTVIDL